MGAKRHVLKRQYPVSQGAPGNPGCPAAGARWHKAAVRNKGEALAAPREAGAKLQDVTGGRTSPTSRRRDTATAAESAAATAEAAAFAAPHARLRPQPSSVAETVAGCGAENRPPPPLPLL